MCDMTHSYVWHDAFICKTWRIHMCDMAHSYVWHGTFICVTPTNSYVWHDSFTRVWYDSFICATWRIHMCGMTHSYAWHDAFICVTWRIHMCDMPHSYVWHDWFICVTWLLSVKLHVLAWALVCGLKVMALCNTPQHTATHGNTRQHTEMCFDSLQQDTGMSHIGPTSAHTSTRPICLDL